MLIQGLFLGEEGLFWVQTPKFFFLKKNLEGIFFARKLRFLEKVKIQRKIQSNF